MRSKLSLAETREGHKRYIDLISTTPAKDNDYGELIRQLLVCVATSMSENSIGGEFIPEVGRFANGKFAVRITVRFEIKRKTIGPQVVKVAEAFKSAICELEKQIQSGM